MKWACSRLLSTVRPWSGALAHGQPLPATHPHLLGAPDMLMPGISRQELSERRTRLAAMLGPDCLAVVPSFRVQFWSQNIFYRFKQSNHVLYLTGYCEPEACVVLRSGRALLFRMPEDEQQLLWEGPKTGDEVLRQEFGFDEVLPLRSLRNYLDSNKTCTIYSCVSGNDCIDVSGLTAKPTKDLTPHLHRLRVVKSASEVEVMRRSASIAASAFKTVMQGRHYQREREIEVDLECLMKRQGAEGLAYVPVVGGGPRACIIHYTRNDQTLGVSDGIVLVDAGAMFSNYCSDVTRTWPIAGQHSQAQLQIYEAVYRVQTAVLEAMQQRAKYSLLDLHTVAHRCTVDELSRLGFKDPKRDAETLFPHSIGHHLGMDLHDCPTIPFEADLSENMVVTVEPGLYIPDSLQFPERFRGIGVRIEDDVLISSHRRIEVLTQAAPKHPQVVFR